MSETTIPDAQPLYPVRGFHSVAKTLRWIPLDSDIVLEYDEGFILTTVSEALDGMERAYTPADLFTIPSRSDLLEASWTL